jgi:hypothetical protein
MGELRKRMRESFDFPGDCIDHIIYYTRVDESRKWREENQKLKACVDELTALVEKANEGWPCTCMAPGMTCSACEYQQEVIALLGDSVAELENPEPCVWTRDEDMHGTEYWELSCGDHPFVFTDGGPEENKFRFCPTCGKPLEVSDE